MKAIDELRLNCIKLHDIGKKLHLKYGTDSYELRCELFDVRKDLETLKEQLNTNVITDNSKVNENLLEENRQLKAKHKEKLKALRKKHKENISDCHDNALDSFVIFTEQQKID